MAEYIRVDDLEVSDYVTVWECDCSEYGKQTVMAVDDLHGLPVVDAVEVVRCNDCKFHREAHYENEGEQPRVKHVCKLYNRTMQLDDFCSYGERRAENERKTD